MGKGDIVSGFMLSDERWNTKSNARAAALRMREKLKQAIEAQVQLVKAELEGTSASPAADAARPLVPWFWKKDERPEYLTVIRYGTSALEFDRQRHLTTIRCGADLAGVLAVYQKVIQAVDSGELDQELDRLARIRGRGRRRE